MSSKNATETLLADRAGIARAARILEECGLVAVPTETVYGLAARADSGEAVAKIYAAKGRPDFNPLIVHVRSIEAAREIADFGASDASWLAEQCWPGPLTLVLPLRKNADLAPAVTAGLDTVAIRMPAHLIMRELLDQVDFPLAAPSANRSGFVSPTSPAHVLATLDGRVDMVLDGGDGCDQGLESTILAIRADGQWSQLRPGPVDVRSLYRERYGAKAEWKQDEGAVGVEAPGQLASHYSPGKPVRLNAKTADDDEFMVGFHKFVGDVSLSERGDLNEAAARLYDCLHRASASAKPRIAIAPVPDEGVGRAINDRLRRAAA